MPSVTMIPSSALTLRSRRFMTSVRNASLLRVVTTYQSVGFMDGGTVTPLKSSESFRSTNA